MLNLQKIEAYNFFMSDKYITEAMFEYPNTINGASDSFYNPRKFTLYRLVFDNMNDDKSFDYSTSFIMEYENKKEGKIEKGILTDKPDLFKDDFLQNKWNSVKGKDDIDNKIYISSKGRNIPTMKIPPNFPDLFLNDEKLYNVNYKHIYNIFKFNKILTQGGSLKYMKYNLYDVNKNVSNVNIDANDNNKLQEPYDVKIEHLENKAEQAKMTVTHSVSGKNVYNLKQKSTSR